MTTSLDALPSPTRLNYTIHSSSGNTAEFQAARILVDNPPDPTSRWTGSTRAKDEISAGVPSSASGSATPLDPSRRKRETQYIILELERPALVTAVGFGKHYKVHPCNLYEFALYGGLTPQARYMEPLLQGALKNDTQKEMFDLPIDAGAGATGRGKGVLLPVKYIRINALSAHTQNYNVSIWHMWLEGISSPEHVDSALQAYEAYRLTLTTHLILAHLRRTSPSLLPTFQSLLAASAPSISSTFENPLLSSLHSTLVVRGAFGAAEELLDKALEERLFREWSMGGGKGRTVARWERIAGEAGGARPWPSRRAGHQMVKVGRKILLHGGWNGEEDLGDLWEYELPFTSTSSSGEGAGGGWRCIHPSPSLDDTSCPRPRSCHVLAFDESTGWAYLLGGKLGPEEEDEYEAQMHEHQRERDGGVESRARREGATTSSGTAPIPIGVPTSEPVSRAARTNGQANGNGVAGAEDVAMDVEEEEEVNPSPREPPRDIYRADFWRYKAVGPGRGKWELLSEDTAGEGGPKLLFDHQMFVHSATQRLFVFGGKIQRPVGLGGATDDLEEERYSGMFCYDIALQRWSHLLGDPTSTDSFRSERLLARFGHSMLFDERASTIYIFSGQRGDTYLSDLWAIKLASPSSDEVEEEDVEKPPITAEAGLWRAGAVLPAALPDSSAAATGRQPTILQITCLTRDYSTSGLGPQGGFTQRATIDQGEQGGWTVLGGLVKERKVNGQDEMGGEVWVRSRDSGVWKEVETAGGESPGGRCGAQVVYDPLRKEHYMFGGNPSRLGEMSRLDDFWRLSIVSPSPDEALRKAKFLVRKQRFTEMCQTRPTLVALQYLQTSLSSVVDHSDSAEASAFRMCMTALLSAPAANNCEVPMGDDGPAEEDVDGSDSSLEAAGGGESAERDEELYRARQALFEELLEFLPVEERQPSEDLKEICGRSREV